MHNAPYRLSPGRRLPTGKLRIVRAIAYIRAGDVPAPAGPDPRRPLILDACSEWQWDVVDVIHAPRTRLVAMFGELAGPGRAADAVVVAHLREAADTVDEYVDLLQRSDAEGWGLAALDAPLPARLAAAIRRERIQRAQREAQRRGVLLGRPRQAGAEVVARILELESSGLSATRIAATLADERRTSPGGGSRWHKSTVVAVLRREGRTPRPGGGGSGSGAQK